MGWSTATSGRRSEALRDLIAAAMAEETDPPPAGNHMTNDERRQCAIRDRVEEILRTPRELTERDPERLWDVDFMILMNPDARRGRAGAPAVPTVAKC